MPKPNSTSPRRIGFSSRERLPTIRCSARSSTRLRSRTWTPGASVRRRLPRREADFEGDLLVALRQQLHSLENRRCEWQRRRQVRHPGGLRKARPRRGARQHEEGVIPGDVHRLGVRGIDVDDASTIDRREDRLADRCEMMSPHAKPFRRHTRRGYPKVRSARTSIYCEN